MLIVPFINLGNIIRKIVEITQDSGNDRNCDVKSLEGSILTAKRKHQ